MGKHTLIIEGDTLEDVAASVAEAHEKLNSPTAATAALEAPKSAKPKAKKEAAPEPEETEEDLLGGGEAVPEPEEEAEAEPTLKDVQNALKEVAEGSGGVPAAKKVLAKFKAAKTVNLKEGEYAAFIKACKAAVK